MTSANPVHPALVAGNIAVVTGGASGIGLASARKFLAMGLRVCLADRNEAALDAVADEFAGIGEILVQSVDVSDQSSVARLAEIVSERFGPVSVIMNNAGVGAGGDALSNPDGWRRVLGVNLIGVLNGVQAFVPAIVAGGLPGLVINTGSKQGITQPPGDTAYNVSKSAIKSLTEGLAHTLRATTGDRVTAHLLIPGFTYTGIMKDYFAEKPAAAWTPEQVIEEMITGLANGDFYILCPDNETSRKQDEKRILWATGDIIHNRPALSRWHPDYKDAFETFMATPANNGRGPGEA